MTSSQRSSSINGNCSGYLDSVILETLKLYSKFGKVEFRTELPLFSLTIVREKLTAPHFELVQGEEVSYQAHDRHVWIFLVLSKTLESELLTRNHSCVGSTDGRRTLTDHLITLLDFEVESRPVAWTGCTKRPYNRWDTGLCPADYEVVLKLTVATCKCTKAKFTDSSGESSEKLSLDRLMWYHEHPAVISAIRRIVAREEENERNQILVSEPLECITWEHLEEEPSPPKKLPRTLIINFEEECNYRSHQPSNCMETPSPEWMDEVCQHLDSMCKPPRISAAASERESFSSCPSHVSETPQSIAGSEMVVWETPQTSPETQESVKRCHNELDMPMSQGFDVSRDSLMTFGTPNSSGGEFGGSFVLQRILDVKRELAEEENQRRRMSLVVPESDLESYDSELFESF